MELVSLPVCGIALHLLIVVFCVVSILGSSRTTGMKVLWLLLVFLFPCGGAIIYFIFGRSAP